jgi:hypothetical protein
MMPAELPRIARSGSRIVLDYLHAVPVRQTLVRRTITIGGLGRTLRTILFARRR